MLVYGFPASTGRITCEHPLWRLAWRCVRELGSRPLGVLALICLLHFGMQQEAYLQRPWWAVGACSRSSSHSVHVVVVVEAYEQDDAEKLRVAG